MRSSPAADIPSRKLGIRGGAWRLPLPGAPFWFLLPALAVYFFFFILPTARAYYLSLFDWTGLGPLDKFIGLGNFVDLARDGHLLVAGIHNFYVFGVLLVITYTVSLGLAVLLDRKNPFRDVYRAIIFLPVVLSPVVTGFIWEIMASPNIGIVNPFLARIGLGFLRHEWLASPQTALPVVTLALAWQWNGLATVILLAGLQNVPAELKDAARVDGAHEWHVFRHITIPHLAPAFTVVTVLLAIYAFRAFDLPYVIGGPAGAPDGQTRMLATEIVLDAFGRSVYATSTHMSYAMAEGIVLFTFLGIAAAALLLYLGRRERDVY